MAETSIPTVPHIPTGDPVLTLETLTNRQHITIDGDPYMLRSLDDYAPSDFSRLLRLGERMRSLIANEEQTPEQGDELKAIIGTLARGALEEVPEEVFTRLRLNQRMALANAFFGMHRKTSLQPPVAPAQEASPVRADGASSPAVSPASTAAHQTTG